MLSLRACGPGIWRRRIPGDGVSHLTAAGGIALRILRAIAASLSTLLVYLGLSLLGWGLGDLRGYFALAPRITYAVLVGVFAIAVAIQAYGSLAGIRGRRGDATKRIGRQTVFTVVLVFAMYAALILLPHADRCEVATLPLGLLPRWLGTFLTGCGFTLVFWSGVALGDMYSKEVTIQPEHRLVTTGLYRTIRHPRYLGVLLMALGLSLVYRSWPGLAACGLLVPFLRIRIRDEEEVLHAQFMEAWEAYVARSWRLVPRVF